MVEGGVVALVSVFLAVVCETFVLSKMLSLLLLVLIDSAGLLRLLRFEPAVDAFGLIFSASCVLKGHDLDFCKFSNFSGFLLEGSVHLTLVREMAAKLELCRNVMVGSCLGRV